MNQAIGVGFVAGAAAAAMAASAMAANSLAMVLFFAAPLPIMAAGLGWGSVAALVAAAIATIATAVVASPLSALAFALTNGIPAVIAAHLMGLARPANEIGGSRDQVAWYPLADTMFRLALAMAAAFIIVGVATGYGAAFGSAIAAELTLALKSANPEFVPGPEFETQLGTFVTRAIPVVQPALSIVLLAANLYLALAIVRFSGRLARPRDDWPMTLRMPRAALIVFAAGIALSFLPSGMGYVGSAIAGAMGGGFLLAGLALLHHRTRGNAWRTFMLWFAYLAIGLFALTIFFFVIVGMFDTSRAAPVSSNPPPGT